MFEAGGNRHVRAEVALRRCNVSNRWNLGVELTPNRSIREPGHVLKLFWLQVRVRPNPGVKEIATRHHSGVNKIQPIHGVRWQSKLLSPPYTV